MRELTLGKIYKNGIQYSGTTDAATNINYDNSKGAIRAGNVQGAIDEIMETTSQSRTLTQAEYDALPDTKYTDGIEYFITDAEPLDASTIAYDNTASKMTATNVQAGIDELNNRSNLISDAWNASTTYAVGKYCIYNNSLWKCLVQHSGQTPTEGTYWTKVTVANEITSVNNSLLGFIDTTNMIHSENAPIGTIANYTATQNCFVVYELTSSNSPSKIYIDDVLVSYYYNSDKPSIQSSILPLKKGQKLTLEATGGASGYKIYALTV